MGILFSQISYDLCRREIKREEDHMLIVNDEHRLRAGIKSLSKRCSYCSKPLKGTLDHER